MRMLKFLSPYRSDAVAFAVLVVSIATVLAVAFNGGEVRQASLHQSVTSSTFSDL
jgi:hypothetical protein